MKFSFLSMSALVVLFACNKDDNASVTQSITPSSFQNHIWVFDSSLTVTLDYSSASYATAQEQTLVFSSDTLMKITGSYSVTYNTASARPDRIYS